MHRLVQPLKELRLLLGLRMRLRPAQPWMPNGDCVSQPAPASHPCALRPAFCKDAPSVRAQAAPSATCAYASSAYVLLAFASGCVLQKSTQLAQIQLDNCENFVSVGPKPKWEPKLIMSCFSPALVIEGQQRQIPLPPILHWGWSLFGFPLPLVAP